MKIKHVVFVMCMCLVFAVVGCGKKGAEPVAVDEKNDKCDVCNMAVMDNQFATEVILENGKALKFDDIGCMYKWMDEHKNEKTQEKFVRDYEIGSFQYADLLNRMCQVNPEARIQSFTDVEQEIGSNQFFEIGFSECFARQG